MTTVNRFSTGAWLLALVIGLGGCAGSPAKESTGEIVDDSVITTKVKTAFLGDKDVKVLDIKVETFKGTVQLSGFVPSASESRKAEQLARGVKGVRAVQNSIQVK